MKPASRGGEKRPSTAAQLQAPKSKKKKRSMKHKNRFDNDFLVQLLKKDDESSRLMSFLTVQEVMNFGKTCRFMSHYVGQYLNKTAKCEACKGCLAYTQKEAREAYGDDKSNGYKSGSEYTVRPGGCLSCHKRICFHCIYKQHKMEELIHDADDELEESEKEKLKKELKVVGHMCRECFDEDALEALKELFYCTDCVKHGKSELFECCDKDGHKYVCDRHSEPCFGCERRLCDDCAVRLCPYCDKRICQSCSSGENELTKCCEYCEQDVCEECFHGQKEECLRVFGDSSRVWDGRRFNCADCVDSRERDAMHC